MTVCSRPIHLKNENLFFRVDDMKEQCIYWCCWWWLYLMFWSTLWLLSSGAPIIHLRTGLSWERKSLGFICLNNLCKITSSPVSSPRPGSVWWSNRLRGRRSHLAIVVARDNKILANIKSWSRAGPFIIGNVEIICSSNLSSLSSRPAANIQTFLRREVHLGPPGLPS